MRPERGSYISREIALSDRNLNVTLIGLSLAIFTFVLIFLYNRALTGQIDPVLFQITLGDAVAAAFSFAVSALYNYILIFSGPAEHVKALLHRRRAELLFTLAHFMLLLEPALILFTVGLVPVASAALLLFLGYLIAYAYASRKTIPEVQKGDIGSTARAFIS